MAELAPKSLQDEDICPETRKPHAPNWASVSVESDGGELYVDVSCRDCGRSGCVGTVKFLSENINW